MEIQFTAQIHPLFLGPTTNEPAANPSLEIGKTGRDPAGNL